MPTDTALYARLRDVLKQDWCHLPEHGTGSPGILLEKKLGLEVSNLDIPDAGRWEIKYHSPRTNLLTLFHLEGQPKGHMHHMVRKFGKVDSKGRISFRHTIHRKHSSIGFRIDNAHNRITVRHPEVSHFDWPYWTHDMLINAFVSKFRRLIAVRGRTREIDGNKQVNYETASLYWEPLATSFVEFVANGTIAIDFDARTRNGDGLRNHGTKFRVSPDDLHHLYNHHKRFD